MYLSVPNKSGIVLPFVGLDADYAITPKMSFQLQYQGAGLFSGGLA